MNTLTKTTLGILITSLATITSVTAQESDKKGERPVPPLFKALDTDGDKTISAEEIAAASAALTALDTDGDGSISESEFRPKKGKGGKKGGKGKGGAE